MSWSPDGSLLVIPTGQLLQKEEIISCAYMFSKKNLTSPILALPVKGVSALVQFSPRFYRIQDNESPLIESQFKFLFSVATYQEIYVYSTCQTTPLYILSNVHYASFTDMSWHSNGQLLAASSMDGFVTFMQIEESKAIVVQNAGIINRFTRGIKENYRSGAATKVSTNFRKPETWRGAASLNREREKDHYSQED
jgi:chromatin assembly factor 1 subunit B